MPNNYYLCPQTKKTMHYILYILIGIVVTALVAGIFISRLRTKLALSEQEKKHEQLISFAKSVSSLQLKAREQKYKNRLDKMEKQTMIMLVCTGGGGMILLLISMVMLLSSAM